MKYHAVRSDLIQLIEMVKLPLFYPEAFADVPKGVLFYGPPGNGKTMTARSLAARCSTPTQPVSFILVNASELMTKWLGDSEKAVRDIFHRAKESQPAIIFFDEIDAIAPCRSARQDQVHNSMVGTLLACMDGLKSRGQVIVIGATNRVENIDPALLRPGRFDRKLEFLPPDRHARLKIIETATKAWSGALDADIKTKMAQSTAGFSGADVKVRAPHPLWDIHRPLRAGSIERPLNHLFSHAYRLSASRRA
ncbi:P-loop containing nucleoside triphosphate hydrolase protein [Blyttiomyces helicus]|uniref:P-loop containing nucleoside triphosphate hydrolase protein n=1 Tax=Blyttiomyces helicus TaxID=388810 RepID=A0A4V1IQM5_9FUNG|nr:P-loop containing nucleoside triphosphate hydrolase protein [Blyttiomyces helicus]|eukprot:RKO87077.1 P-loop containing nucleoside triphosphate hydrolase protein [Blyttiomyces helicus]